MHRFYVMVGLFRVQERMLNAENAILAEKVIGLLVAHIDELRCK